MAQGSGVVTGGSVTATKKINTNLSSKEQYLVNINTSDDAYIALAAGATLPLFVLKEGADGSSTETVGTIVLFGPTKVKLGGTVTPGAHLTSDGSGLAIATTTSGNRVAGIALAAGVANDVIPMLAIPSVY